jgi:hypothetical protein
MEGLLQQLIPPPNMPQITPGAFTAPAMAQVQGLIMQINASTGTVQVGANPLSAQLGLQGLIIQINSSTGTVQVGANTGPGVSSTQGLLGWIRGQGANVGVGAATGGAYTDVDALVRYINSRVATIHVRTQQDTTIQAAQGGIFAYRDGGIHSGLRPMPANRAEIVPPKAMRVIGDRARGDEAFIPLVNTARSHAIFRAAGARLGYDVTPRNQQAATTRTTTIEAGAVVVNAPNADPRLVARAVVNELTREAVI